MAELRNMTNWIRGLVSAILLLVVAAHAVAPLEADHGRSRGSAFSASTEEVSLKAGTRTPVAKELIKFDSTEPVAMAPVAIATVRIASPLADAPAPAESLARIALTPISPRAPPFA